jgi:Cu(I)/Ag(I) efflux system membrane fusion protein
MKYRTMILGFAVVGLAAAGGYGLYRAGVAQGVKMAAMSTKGDTMEAPNAGAQKAGDIDPQTGKKVLYWHDPMVPGQKFDRPGKSPFMDMQLVPVYADSGGERGVTINPRVQQNLGVRTAEVTRGTLTSNVEAVGSVAYNERDVAVVQARANGFVERLQVRALLDPVRQGQALAELYVPDWVAAQEDYLAAKRISTNAHDGAFAGVVDAARQRMRLAGMSEEQIRHVEESGAVQARTTLVSPISGVVTELAARDGMTVMAGAPLFRLNGLSTVWVNAEIAEAQAAQVRPGNPIEARTAALPGAVFKGKVSAILPEVNAATRTIKARIEVANPGARLVPGMFANISFMPGSEKETLWAPSEAVIQTGKRSVVILAQANGQFTPMDVEIGRDNSGRTEILRGLEAGQKVVVSGQFLVDSEANLKASATRMNEMPGVAPALPAAAATHHGEGRVERIDKDEITISHGPIASLQWGAMTMGFKLPADALPSGIAVGDAVSFDFRPRGDGTFEIAAIAPLQGKGAMSPSDNTAKGRLVVPDAQSSGAKP